MNSLFAIYILCNQIKNKNTMKTFKWKRLGFMLAIVTILMGNLIGISALATEDGNPGNIIDPENAPTGVLVGYTPEVERQKSGEHFEYFGWVGASFSRLVTDYSYYLCCKKTLRAMDGCKDLKICPN
ncbi:MAG: hypothetical protein D4R64_01185 [Porphyromonadaceae bacterium]|nr:MAG: hypothetical protein D4R64_01185 [Porphyromonadaceae bacterium]